MITVRPTIKCDLPRRIKTNCNCNIKPKLTTVGFETGTQNPNYWSDALSITPNSYLHYEGDMYGVNIVGATLLRRKRGSHYL